jgi:hypothetical protein
MTRNLAIQPKKLILNGAGNHPGLPAPGGFRQDPGSSFLHFDGGGSGRPHSASMRIDTILPRRDEKPCM